MLICNLKIILWFFTELFMDHLASTIVPVLTINFLRINILKHFHKKTNFLMLCPCTHILPCPKWLVLKKQYSDHNQTSSVFWYANQCQCLLCLYNLASAEESRANAESQVNNKWIRSFLTFKTTEGTALHLSKHLKN